MTKAQYDWTKRGIIILGGLIAVIGSVIVDGNIRSLDDRLVADEGRQSTLLRVISRNKEGLSEVRAVVNEQMGWLISMIGQRRVSDKKYRYNLSERTADAVYRIDALTCEAADTSDDATARRSQKCSTPSSAATKVANRYIARLEGGYYLANLIQLREDFIADEGKLRLPGFSAQYRLEKELEDTKRSADAKRDKKAAWTRWQTPIALLGVLIALAKDLVPEPTPSRTRHRLVRHS